MHIIVGNAAAFPTMICAICDSADKIIFPWCTIERLTMKDKCPHCGNNQVSHISAWVNNSFSVASNRLYPAVFGGKEQKIAGRLVTHANNAFLALCRLLGMITTYTDSDKAVTDRGRFLWEEANRRGIEVSGLIFLGRYTDSYIARVAGREIYFSGIPRPAYTSTGSDWWLDDKAILKERLTGAGIAVPAGGSFRDFDECARFFDNLEKPVVVKPQLGSRGRHTTTHIYTREQLCRAFDIAKQISYWIVLEEHLEGSVYRATIIDGKVAGVLRGDPPRVVGDGKSSIRQLVKKKNTMRHEKVSEIILNGRHADFLSRTGRDFATIPDAGESIDLLASIGVSYGGHSKEVTQETHSETKRIMERAAAVVGDPIIGFDFIIPDIEKSPESQRWGIIECNSTPFINLHHDPVEGAPVNAAKHVWDYVEKHRDRY
jgi:cyanophycin synthetase